MAPQLIASSTDTHKRLVLKTYSSHSEYNADFDLAIIDLTPDMLKTLQVRHKAFDTARLDDRNLAEMQYHDCAPVWCAEADLESWLLDKAEDLPDWFTSIQFGGEAVECPIDYDPTARGEGYESDFRSECDRMNVDDYGVSWECIPKHSEITITTATITWKELGL